MPGSAVSAVKRLAASFCAALVLASPAAGAQAEKVLRVAATFADIPLTTGQPSQGGEGQRFVGYQLYDALIRWDLSRADVAASLAPGLAQSWSSDAATHKVWTFKLRPGVKFHDGSAFDAESVVWNLDKVLNRGAAQFDQAQATQASQYVLNIASYRVVDPLTVEIATKAADATFPYMVAGIMISSPARYKELGGDWSKIAFKPSGTGPWMLDKLVPREKIEMVRNPNYWDPARVPKSDRLVVLAMPDSNTRVAALLSGQVDWIEAPPPDTIPRLKSGGMQIVTNIYPHIWPYQLSYSPDSPFRDIRIRKAANLAIDRVGLSEFLGGTAMPARGMVDPKHPWFGKPNFKIEYNPTEARRLMKEAGYTPEKPLKIKLAVSTAGSGQMQPLPMNEFIQENFKEVGIDAELVVMEWEELRAHRRAGSDDPSNKGIAGINNSFGYWDPFIGLLGVAGSKLRPPAGYNWGGFSDPETDRLVDAAFNEFDPAKQNEILAQLHARIVDQAMWIWVVHDLNPRALGPKVKGFVQAQSWYQDLTPVYVE
ncbi:ABC transporter substrate-binding protein [Achromobacter aloeverae]|uniref:ABC transporter substrate-binding protein n=1 Tax=Achromobacter aloeverae TaxID=1750518 RepID=A0A4Q1HHL7_9BURK|nr:ABC transporter substrate-binding protein [Achromobacter aloeverae]RXN86986.1 ABC transporter substrate-binding protein [Achromobacter aloeverae]